MIYFTEIKNSSDKKAPMDILFQFYPKELPENISIKNRTKLNKIEYNGGVISNQIIGVFREPVEWEGCFFGTYTEGGRVISAKQRAEKLKKLQGRQIRCIFAVPSTDNNIPGITSAGRAGNKEDKAQSGDSGIYIIEELDLIIHNHSDIDYRIRLTPDTVQTKIKPKDVSVQAVKVRPDIVRNSAGEVLAAEPKSTKGNSDATNAKNEAAASRSVADNFNQERLKSGLPPLPHTGKVPGLPQVPNNKLNQKSISARSGK